MAKRKNNEKRMKLLMGIINREDEAKFSEVANEYCAALGYSTLGFGTARSNYLSYFGINEIEKRVIMMLIPDVCEHQLLEALGRRLRLYLLGRGIAFTLPLSGISSIVSGALSDSADKNEKQGDKGAHVQKKEKVHMYELVIAVVNQKFTDEVIDAARDAGATGATIMHTKGIGNEKAEQRLGTTLKHETDTLMFLTSHEFKKKIMEAVRDTAGLQTEGGAVIYSLAVDDIVGKGRFDGTDESAPED